MTTAQLFRNANDTQVGRWEAMFPNEQSTELQSISFVKKVLAVAVSTITYLRALFPEAAYGDRCLESVNLKILKDDSAYPDACKIIRWLHGCFDALEKKYLRGVLIGIYDDPDDTETVIEQYTFKFSYGDGNGVDIYRNNVKIMSSTNDKETKKATVRLLRTIVILSQTLVPLPDDVFMTMKLIYYDEVTPSDYDPPGFKKSESDDFSFKDKEPVNIKVGEVSTNFHSFKLRIKTLHSKVEPSEDCTQVVYQEDKENNSVHANKDALVPGEDVMNDEAECITSIYSVPGVNKGNGREMEEKPGNGNSISIYTEESEEFNPVGLKRHFVKSPSEMSHTAPNTIESVPITSDEMITLCPCGVNEDDGLMILCSSCNTWQHATCFGIINPNDVPIAHYCIKCSNNCEYICTDKMLYGIKGDKKVKKICLWRRALLACTHASGARILPSTLSKMLGISTRLGSGLLQRLEKEGFVKSVGKGKRVGKCVQEKEILGRGVDEYFQKTIIQNHDDKCLSEKTSNMEITEERNIESSYIAGVKRKSGEATSSHNPGLTFDVSDSQVHSSQKKRKKSSISTHPVAV